jgi:hypothetical protein
MVVLAGSPGASGAPTPFSRGSRETRSKVLSACYNSLLRELGVYTSFGDTTEATSAHATSSIHWISYACEPPIPTQRTLNRDASEVGLRRA